MSKRIAEFTPGGGYGATYGATGLIRDAFTPTTAYQLNSVRDHGRAECKRLGVDAVTFRVVWHHQFPGDVTVDALGFIRECEADLTPAEAIREAKQIQ